MGKLVRAISEDGSVMACAMHSTDIVGEIEKIHKTSAVVTAALGRLATAASMMGYMLKGDKDTLTLRINGNGPTGSLVAVANSSGNVKAYSENAVVELPLNQYGKLDVKGAVGVDGFLSVIKDLGMKEPYVGQIPIATGEIAEDITSYYAISEQIPTVCGLGVLVNPDLTVRAAGGYIVQLLPYADEACIDIIEENIRDMQSVSSLVAGGVSPEALVDMLLKNLNPNVLDETVTAYKCDCSKDRVERAIASLGIEELISMRDEDEAAEVCCHFCDKKYTFGKADLTRFIENR